MSSKYLLTRTRLWRTRAATALAAAGALVMSSGVIMMSAPTATAAPPVKDVNTKVWICKYSHTPEIGEKAQTVNSVDYHEGREPGTWGFEDAQGATYVYGWSEGPDAVTKPDKVADCPPYTPPGVIEVPGAPGQSDPCGPDNATWNVPADTATFDWEVIDGVLTVSILTPGTTFPDGSTTHSYGTATDSGTACPPDVVPVPAEPDVTDPCGPDNATWKVPADTATFDWEVIDGVLTVSVLTPGTTFPDGSTTHSYGTATDSGTACPSNVVEVPQAPAQNDPCGPGNATWNLPADTDTFDWSLSEAGVLSVSIVSPNTTFPDGSTTHSYGTATDSGTACPPGQVAIPAQPDVTDPCGPDNNAFLLPGDTATLDWTQLENGDVTVTPQPGYVFPGNSQLITFELPADTNEPCVLGTQKIAPKVSFQDPTCAKPNRTTWSGNLTDLVDYTVTGTAGRGKSITVTASVKPAVADEFSFPEGYDATFEHSYPTLTELQCVKGTESVRPKPSGDPTVLGTSAVVPTAVDAGVAGAPGSTPGNPLAQLMVAGGLVLLLAGGWVGFGRREHGAREA